MMLEQLKLNQNEFSFAVSPVKQEETRGNSGADFLSMIKDNMYSPEKKTVPAKDVSRDKVRSDRPAVQEEKSVRPEKVKSEKLKLAEDEKKSAVSGEIDDKKEIKNATGETVHLDKEKKGESIDSDWDKIEQSLLNDDLIVSLLGKEGIKELVKAMKSSSENENKSFSDNPGLENMLKKLESLSLKNMEKLQGFNELSADEKESFKKVFSELKNLLQKGNSGQGNRFLSGESEQSTAVKVSIKDLQSFMENLISFADGKKSRHARKHENNHAYSTDKNSSALSGELPVLNKVTISEEAGRDKSMSDGGENKDSLSFSSGKNVQADRILNDKQSIQGRMPEFKQSLQDIIDKAKITVRDSRNGKFNVKLYPKELGNVNVSLSLENGIVHGRFLVDNDEAKNLLMQNLDHLREMLKESGIEVGDFSVNVSDQREQFAGDDAKDGNNKVLENSSDKVLVAGEYEINSASIHNGRINLVI